MSKAILCVDDEIEILKLIERTLKNEDYKVFSAKSGEEALALLKKEKIQVIVTDQYMPGMKGHELLSKVQVECPKTVCMVISYFYDSKAILDLIKNGSIHKFIKKPWTHNELKTDINECFAIYENKFGSI